MNVLRSSLQIVREHSRPYVILNVMYYGLVALGMLYVAFINPALQEQLLAATEVALTEGPLETVAGAYMGGNVLAAVLLTFVVNLLVGSLLFITVPSLVIPFAGVLLGFYRAVLWGFLLAPTNAELALVMIPHSLVLLLEGQGYILAMFAAYVHGKAFLRPVSAGLTSHLRGYVAGLKLSARLYSLVITVLAVAAIYEALEVILMVRVASGLG